LALAKQFTIRIHVRRPADNPFEEDDGARYSGFYGGAQRVGGNVIKYRAIGCLMLK